MLQKSVLASVIMMATAAVVVSSLPAAAHDFDHRDPCYRGWYNHGFSGTSAGSCARAEYLATRSRSVFPSNAGFNVGRGRRNHHSAALAMGYRSKVHHRYHHVAG